PLGLGNDVAELVVGQPKDKLKPAVQVGAQGGFKRRLGEVSSRIAHDAAIDELGINLARNGRDLRQHLAMAEQLNVVDFSLEIVAGVALELAEAGKYLFGSRGIDSSFRIKRFPAFVDVERASGAKTIVIQGREDHRIAEYK